MIWQGKALGALIGVFAAGPVGALFGAFIGHLFDVQVEAIRPPPVRARLQVRWHVQEAYFRGVFQVMGHLAKADGRVSEDEIRAARAIMSEFRLGEREMRLAMEFVHAGQASRLPARSDAA